MTFIRFFIFWLCLLFPLLALESQAENLDIFDSNQKFATDFLFKDRIKVIENADGFKVMSGLGQMGQG